MMECARLLPYKVYGLKFVVNGEDTISGAQAPEAFASLIREVLENAGTEELVATGTQCSVADGTC
jgi:hypothetical protein